MDPPVVSWPENQGSESMGALGSRVVKFGDVAHVCKASTLLGGPVAS